jgi:ABC-type transport system involved in multi-copper enzyme maturation permease subunit
VTGALRYEWARIRTIASTYWMSGLAIVLTAGLAVLLASTVSRADFDEAGVDNSVVTNMVILAGGALPTVPILTAAFMSVLGVLAMGHEYRYGTNKATLCALPDRLAVVAAKIAVLAVWVAGVVATVVVLNIVIAFLLMDQVSLGSDSVRPVLAYLLYCEGFAIAGLGLAALLRNQTGAMVAVLVWPFVLEPVFYAVLALVTEATDSDLATLTNFLPAAAGRRTLFDPYSLWAGYGGSIDTWGLGLSFLVFVVGVAAAAAAGAASFISRDA